MAISCLWKVRNICLLLTREMIWQQEYIEEDILSILCMYFSGVMYYLHIDNFCNNLAFELL